MNHRRSKKVALTLFLVAAALVISGCGQDRVYEPCIGHRGLSRVFLHTGDGMNSFAHADITCKDGSVVEFRNK